VRPRSFAAAVIGGTPGGPIDDDDGFRAIQLSTLE
jgi:hypothetical protein